MRIQAICEFKRRNPRFGCPRIAQHLAKSFGLEINKDVVRRVLARHYHPGRRDSGPSWLTFLGDAKDSLWSLDLFRTESIQLKTHWVPVVMDQFSRRIVGFGVQAVAVDGAALCRMFNQAISGQGLPVRLSSDHDPLFQFQCWQANLRIDLFQYGTGAPGLGRRHASGEGWRIGAETTEQTPNASNAESCKSGREPAEKAEAAADAGKTTVERIATAADELFRLRAQAAQLNERLRNLATILELATVVLGPSVERAELVLHGLSRSKQICYGLIAATD